MPDVKNLTLIDELTEQRAQLSDLMDEMVSAPDFDNENEDWKGAQERAVNLEKRIEAVRKASEMRDSVDRLRQIAGKPSPGNSGEESDIGLALIKSHAFQAYVRNGATGRAKLLTIPIYQRAALSTGFFPSVPDRITAAPPRQQASLLSVLNKQRVSTGTVEVVTYPSADPLAGVVAEGALKPEATLTVTVNSYTLDTLAHWIEATRQLLEDETRVKDFVSNSLLRGVYDKAEAEATGVLNGGTGYIPVAGDSMAEAIRIGVAEVQSAGYSPNAVVINPIDAAGLDFFIWDHGNGSPSIGGNVWGMQVVAQAGVPAGTAYVGDWNAAIQHFYRGEAEVFVSDSDVGIDGISNFKRNIISFLAEMRAKTVITRPEAIAKCIPGTPPITRSTKPAAPVSTK